jgi:hypothetical protein
MRRYRSARPLAQCPKPWPDGRCQNAEAIRVAGLIRFAPFKRQSIKARSKADAGFNVQCLRTDSDGNFHDSRIVETSKGAAAGWRGRAIRAAPIGRGSRSDFLNSGSQAEEFKERGICSKLPRFQRQCAPEYVVIEGHLGLPAHWFKKVSRHGGRSDGMPLRADSRGRQKKAGSATTRLLGAGARRRHRCGCRPSGCGSD